MVVNEMRFFPFFPFWFFPGETLTWTIIALSLEYFPYSRVILITQRRGSHPIDRSQELVEEWSEWAAKMFTMKEMEN